MEPISCKIAIPRFGESVAPCFGYSATVSIFAVAHGAVTGQTDFVLQTSNELDRLRLLKDQAVDTLICGGLQDRLEDIIEANGIRVISWVTGTVEDLLGAHLQGDLRGGQRHRDDETSPISTESERRGGS